MRGWGLVEACRGGGGRRSRPLAGTPSIGVGRGSGEVPSPRRRTWASLVRRGPQPRPAGGGRWLPRTETRRFAVGSAIRGDPRRSAAIRGDPRRSAAIRGDPRRCCGTSLRQANEGGARGRRREGRTAVRRRDEVGDGGDDADGRSLVGRREGGVLSMAKRTLSCRPRRRSRDRQGTCRNCVCFGPCGVDQGTVAKRSAVAVAGGPVVPGTMASVSR